MTRLAGEATSQTNGSITGEYRNIGILFAEAFLRREISTINEKITSDIGISLEDSDGGKGGMRKRISTLKWEGISADRLVQIISSVCDAKEKETIGTLASIMDHASIGSFDDSDFPFYVVYMYLIIKKEFTREMDFNYQLFRIREAARKYLPSLPGSMSQHRRHGSGSPAILFADMKVEKRELTRLNDLLSSLADKTTVEEHRMSIAFEINSLQPTFSGDKVTGHAKSYFVIDENLHAIVGSFGGVIPYDSTCPYLLIMTSGDEYESFGHFYDHLSPYDLELLSGNPWAWLDAFVFAVMVESWLYESWHIIRRHNQFLSEVSEKMLGGPSDLMTDADLNQITKIGLEISALEIDLCRVKAYAGYGLDNWSRGDFGPLHEISIPFDGHLKRLGFDGKSGYLPLVGKSVKGNYEEMELTIASIQNQIRALSDYGNQMAMRKSILASERSSRSIEFLTWSLLMLTLVLVVLEMGRSSQEYSGLLPQIMSVLLIPAFFLLYLYTRIGRTRNSVIVTLGAMLGAFVGLAVWTFVRMISTVEVAEWVGFCGGITAAIILSYYLYQRKKNRS